MFLSFVYNHYKCFLVHILTPYIRYSLHNRSVAVTGSTTVAENVAGHGFDNIQISFFGTRCSKQQPCPTSAPSTAPHTTGPSPTTCRAHGTTNAMAQNA